MTDLKTVIENAPDTLYHKFMGLLSRHPKSVVFWCLGIGFVVGLLF